MYSVVVLIKVRLEVVGNRILYQGQKYFSIIVINSFAAAIQMLALTL